MNKNLVVTAAVSAVVSATVALTLGGGAALAALHYYGNQTIVQGSGSVSCPVDYVLTGGGFGKLPANTDYTTSNTTYRIVASYPIAQTQTWKAEGIKTSGRIVFGAWKYTESSFSPSVYAVCVK